MAVVAAWFWIDRATPPNVIVITIDTLRADHLGSYGDRDAATPTLDRLARRGVRFAEAVAHAPLTLPSHASLFTGLTPARHGIRNNPEFALDDSVPTLAERFHAAGYDTAAFVSGFPLSRRFGLARGFDVYDDRFPRGDARSDAPYTERRADATVAAARAWVSGRQGDPATKPYLLWTHLFDPHRPYDPPEPFLGRFRDRPYDGEIAFVDAQIAGLLAAVGDPDQHRTIVLITADHGEGLDEHREPTHGLFIYNSTIRVPLILAGPGVPAGRTVDSVVRLIDVAPTLLDLAHLPALSGIDGRTLTTTFGNGSASVAAEPAYIESLFGRLCCGWAPLHGWRDGAWMYIDAPAPELYDVANDPDQRVNLAAMHPAEVARYRAAVRKIADTAGERRSRDAASTNVLASVGYFSGSSSVKPSLRDPKDTADLAARMEDAIARERADPAAAASELRHVIDADPSNGLARRHLAIALTGTRDYAGAIREIEALKQIGDTSLETAILLGESQRLAGRPADAVRTLEDAIARDGREPAAHDSLGRALAAAGQRDAAVAAFGRALALQPDDAEALGALADLAIERGDLAAARQHLQRLHGRDSGDDGVTVKLGTVLARSGDLPAARRLLEAVVARSPANVDALVNLAAVLAKSGDAAAAVRHFERAVQAGATAPVVLNGLGAARLDLGDLRGALAAFQRSLQSRPDQQSIRDLAARIERDLATPARAPAR